MNHKTFDHGTYRKDDKAKMQIMKWMSQQGYSEVRTNPDQYAIDVLASWYGEPVAFEVEVKHNWRGEEFPFSTCHFSARKRKFLDPLMRVRFAMLNHNRDRFVMFKGEDLLVQGRIVKKDTIYTSDEEFIEIDSRWGQVFDL
jgi:hypothetical protein